MGKDTILTLKQIPVTQVDRLRLEMEKNKCFLVLILSRGRADLHFLIAPNGDT